MVILVLTSCAINGNEDIDTTTLSSMNVRVVDEHFDDNSPPGIVPSNNPVFKAFFHSPESFQEAHELYLSNIPQAKNLYYYSNLKVYGFIIVFEGSLLTEGTEAQKFYYLEEQTAMDMNLPNLENVYKLLESCNSFIPKEQIEAFQNSLYTKNKNWIESHEFNNTTTKKERLDKLNLLHQNAQTHTTKI